MKKIALVFAFIFFQASAFANDIQTPTARVKVAVDSILTIAADESKTDEERKAGLMEAIKTHVDLQAASQRVLARHWRTASREEKLEFMRMFRLVLTNTYGNLLETYNNEEVLYVDEEIKKEKYASVDTIVISGGKEIPVTYQLINRNDEWKVYDFVAEGISVVRSFSTDYQSVLRKVGVTGLNEQLSAKLESNESP